MAIEKDEHGNVTITGQDIPFFQILALRGMLRLEVNSNGAMKASSKGSPFAMLKRLGIIPANTKTKKEGLLLVNEYIKVQQERRTKNAQKEQNNGNADS